MAARTTHPSARAWPTDTCLWGPRPLLLVGKQAAGTRVASSPDSDLEAFSHNPAHGSFAPLAFQPSAMTNCANQRCAAPSQTPHLTMSSARIGLPRQALGPKRGALPRFRSRNNRIPLVRTSSELAVRRPGKAPEGAVPSPSPGRHAATRSRAEAARAVRRQPTGSGLGPPCPALREPILFPRLRNCSPWRPDAVMSTTGRGRHSVLRIFKGRRGRTGHRATCGALPAAGPYLRLSHPHRRPLRPGSRPRFCSDRRALLLIGAWHLPRRPGVGRALKRHPFSGLVDSADERFARQYRCGPPPEFPLASPRSGIVHHLSGPDRHAHTRTLLRRSRSVGGAPR
ncbi:hypothetical protein L1887_51993 [Cichorium endivia]|nr:hypothetical protein L1887_51993 [Cichorium endivia]